MVNFTDEDLDIFGFACDSFDKAKKEDEDHEGIKEVKIITCH